jgi:hypothetical protein
MEWLSVRYDTGHGRAGHWAWDMAGYSCMAFAVWVSATDPVTVIRSSLQSGSGACSAGSARH